MGEQRSGGGVARTVVGLHGLVAVGLFAYHVRAESSFGDGDGDGGSEDATTEDVIGRILSGPASWNLMDKIAFGILITMGMELLGWLVKHSGGWMGSKLIPVRGKHLDELRPVDRLFIGISKAQTGPFVYFFLRFICSEDANNFNVLWGLEDLSFRTAILPLPLILIVFDFFYAGLHWFLHIRAIYPYIHKHHHVQKAPSRGNEDAINVHPVEFFLGEYNHLWSWFLCCNRLGLRVHVLAALLYMVLAGALAGWNHTRFDLTLSFLGVTLFDSKAHDVHHRVPQSNYSQYSMFWDHVFGTFRPYNPDDRIKPDAQLDPKTGMSIEYSKQLEMGGTSS